MKKINSKIELLHSLRGEYADLKQKQSVLTEDGRMRWHPNGKPTRLMQELLAVEKRLRQLESQVIRAVLK